MVVSYDHNIHVKEPTHMAHIFTLRQYWFTLVHVVLPTTVVDAEQQIGS